MSKKYRVLVGFNSPPNNRRANVGDVVDDLLPEHAAILLARGAIEEFVEPEAGKRSGKSRATRTREITPDAGAGTPGDSQGRTAAPSADDSEETE